MSPGQKAVPRGDFTFDGGMVVAIQNKTTENKQIKPVMNFSPIM